MSEKEDFSWNAGVTSAEGYPIEVHTGYLATKKEFITAFSNVGEEKEGWGFEGADMNAGGNEVPTLVSITWVSYGEKKFWKLDEGELPKDIILKHFRKGFFVRSNITNKLEHQTYNRIVVAVAPGGTVGVFLTGDYHRVEVARLQAKETFVSVNEFYNNPDNDTQQEFFDWYFEHSFSTEKKEEIVKNGIPYGLWDQYRTKFNWRVVPEFYKEDNFIDNHINYFNGEEEYFYKDELDKKLYHKKPLPQKMSLTFDKYWYEAVFDWQEFYAACKSLAKNDPDAPIDIIAKVGFEYNTINFSVKSGERRIRLEKTTGHMWGIKSD